MIGARMAAVAMLMCAPIVAATQGPPGDRDVRTTKDTVTGDTLTTLTLMLAGPKEPLPINMAITVIRPAKPGGAAAHRLDFDMPLYTGPLDQKTPQVAFTLDDGQGLSFSVDPRAIPPSVTHITATTFTVRDLSRMAAAKAISGRLFGIEFALTADQVRAIRDFARR
jgi:hypothetical protein